MILPRQAIPILRHTDSATVKRNRRGVSASQIDCYSDTSCRNRLQRTFDSSDACCSGGGRSYRANGGECRSCPIDIPRRSNQPQDSFPVGGPPRSTPFFPLSFRAS